ncbi:DNA (cytosine-5-)-methyltransferase [Microbacterium sp. NPDC076768]|uniref:DNA cytosine methyltransferase n=1 Tax=Microbacterium sp. NPDC076768 TaxID=3154858 RepID=UPI00342D70B8
MGELFSGPGGIALGAHAAAAATGVDLRHAWANDYDASAVETYRANIPGATAQSVIHGDVRDLDVESLPKIDGFAFGFPCNDYSMIGESKGLDGNFGPLYKYGVNVLDAHRPNWFVAENVSGLQTANAGLAFPRILEELRHAGPGYELTPHLYKFEEYGVPQRRHRIIIVGLSRENGARFAVPAPTHKDPTTWKSVRNALGGLVQSAPNNERTRQSKVVEERLAYINPGQNAFNAALPDHLKLNVKGATFSQIYRRLHPDLPSYTITGSGGGGTHGYHWEEVRALTNRERARIQTFPDTFVFKGSKEQVRKQVGMAVPPDGAEVIFSALFRTLRGEDYDSVPMNLTQMGAPSRP